jgi:hypothetical protein
MGRVGSDGAAFPASPRLDKGELVVIERVELNPWKPNSTNVPRQFHRARTLVQSTLLRRRAADRATAVHFTEVAKEGLQSPGQLLDANTRAFMELLFGHDFSRVPVHAFGPEGRAHEASCPLAPRRRPFGGACHTCPARVQAKLAINQPGDAYEQEADWVTEEVVHTGGVYLQRRAAGQVQPAAVPPIVHEVLRSPDQRLDTSTRDSGRVRVRANNMATQSAQAM